MLDEWPTSKYPEWGKSSRWPSSTYSTGNSTLLPDSSSPNKVSDTCLAISPEEYEKGGSGVITKPTFETPCLIGGIVTSSSFKTGFDKRPSHRQHDHFIWVILIWIPQTITQCSPGDISPVFHSHIFGLSINSHTHFIHYMGYTLSFQTFASRTE